MNNTSSNEIVSKINRVIAACVLLVIVTISGFYIYTKIQALLDATPASYSTTEEKQKIVTSEEKESLLSRIRQAGNSDIEEVKRLNMLKDIPIKKTVDVKQRETALGTLIKQ